MLHRILLTLILATTPAYLHAAHANASASAATDVKTAAAQQQAKPVQVPADIISPQHYRESRVKIQFNAIHCKRIIEWLKADPQNRKNAQFEREPLLQSLARIRFNMWFASPDMQPALEFLLSLKPDTNNMQRTFNAICVCGNSKNPKLSPKDAADLSKLAKQLTRLIFQNGHNLQLIKDHITDLSKKPLMDFMEPERLEDMFHAFQIVLDEVETIRQEAVEKVVLISRSPHQVLLPDLLKIVGEYSTELSLAQAQRALKELSTPVPQ